MSYSFLLNLDIYKIYEIIIWLEDNCEFLGYFFLVNYNKTIYKFNLICLCCYWTLSVSSQNLYNFILSSV